MITTICMLARDQDLRITRIPTVANGNVKTVEIDVKTDQMWEGLSLSAVFFNSEKGPVYEILLTNGKCTVPHEVLEKKTTLHIGLRGTAPDQKKVSTLVTYDIKKGAPESNATAEGPTPDVYQQILKRLDEIDLGVPDEQIEEAVTKYLENNPVSVVVDDAFSEGSENPVQNKVITKKIRELSEQINDKLDASKLPEAVDDALAQAKASGEFDGADGYTPVKGTDYYTEADKTEMVNTVLNALPTWTGGSY